MDKTNDIRHDDLAAARAVACAAVVALSAHGTEDEKKSADEYDFDDVESFDFGVKMKDGLCIEARGDGVGDPIQVYTLIEKDDDEADEDDGSEIEDDYTPREFVTHAALAMLCAEKILDKDNEENNVRVSTKQFGDFKNIEIRAEMQNGEQYNVVMTSRRDDDSVTYDFNEYTEEDYDFGNIDEDGEEEEYPAPMKVLTSAVAVDDPRDMVEKIISNPPATIIYWKNGDKTVVRCSSEDEYNLEQGIALCFLKYAFGNTGRFNDLFHNLKGSTGVVFESK